MGTGRVYIITGKQGGGKTTLAGKVSELLLEKGMHVAGFLAHGEWSGGLRNRFYIRDIETGRRILLCDASPHATFNRHGRFYFNPEAIKYGGLILKNAGPQTIVLLDEVGKFELEGHVWAAALLALLAENDRTLLITVRDEAVDDVVTTFGMTKYRIFPCETDPDQIVAEIAETGK